MAKLQSVGSVAGKETIYVDVDDEITAVIDKVNGAKGKVVALVLPKRATVLQSIVNMKLLKRTAETAGKNLVLVTSEAGLLPLAGNVGLYVADTPSSKPFIPVAPSGPSDEPEDIDEPLHIVDNSAGTGPDFDPKAAAEIPVGELAGTGVARKIADDDIDESIDMDDAAPVAAALPKSEKAKKDKKLKVPNFDSFRKKLLLGAGVLVLLVVAYIFAFIVLPKATVTIHTDTSTIMTNLNLTLTTSAKTLDQSNDTVPATSQTQQKTATQTVASTGQQNNGQQASGTVTITNCGPNAISINAGTSFTANGYTFISQSNGSVQPSDYTFGGKCRNDNTATFSVTALKGGSDYNLAPQNYTFSDSSQYVTASGSQMSGGTDNIIKVVSQNDINNATNQIKAADSSSIKQQLISALQAKGLQAVGSSFIANSPQVTSSAKAGDTADSVTVTAVTTYSMLGVQKSDLKTLVDANVNKQIDKGKQTILDDGVANAVFSQQNPPTATSDTVSMAVKSVAGPELDTAQLPAELAGKKTGDVKATLAQTPGVTSVDVHYSPFWVSSIPKNVKKINVVVDKPSTVQ